MPLRTWPLLLLLSASAAVAQEAAQPLSALPYAPSLDMTSLDRSVDPCMDFYRYACGGWVLHHPNPTGRIVWESSSRLGDAVEGYLQGILIEDATPGPERTPIQQKVGDFYEACMNTDAIARSEDGERGDTRVLRDKAALEQLPDRSAVEQALLGLQHDHFGEFFFRVLPAQDPNDPEKVVIDVAPAEPGLIDPRYYLSTEDKVVQLRQVYAGYIQELLQASGVPFQQAQARAQAVLHVETVLATSIVSVSASDARSAVHSTTLAQLKAQAAAIDWDGLLALYGVKSVPAINVEQPAYLTAMQQELATEPVEVLKAYLVFHLLNGAAEYLPAAYEQRHFKLYGTFLRGVTRQYEPRAESCTRVVKHALPDAVDEEFVRRAFTPDTRVRVSQMTAQIEAAMEQELKGLDWISPETRKEALAKLHAVRNRIGYPDAWADYSRLLVRQDDFYGDALRARRFEQDRVWSMLDRPMDHALWNTPVIDVNARYRPQGNDIVIPAAYLQPPLYDPKMDDAANYGATGSTIGHELTHALDANGIQFDAGGRLRAWSAPADAKRYAQRAACLSDQYSSYTLSDNVHLNGTLTSNEDVADLGGALLAYMAWKKESAGRRPVAIDGLTPEQRFFIAFAQTECENVDFGFWQRQVLEEVHSPGFARVNGVVSNLPQFQRAFGCRAGQPMVHTPACKVW